MNVLVVCTGNYCRSQIAHAILESMYIPDMEVRSAGTSRWGIGREPSPLVARVIYDLTGLVWNREPKQLTSEDALWSNLILTMEPEHDTYVRVYHPGAIHKVKMLSELAGEVEPVLNPHHEDEGAIREAAFQIEAYLLAGEGWLREKVERVTSMEKYAHVAP